MCIEYETFRLFLNYNGGWGIDEVNRELQDTKAGGT